MLILCRDCWHQHGPYVECDGYKLRRTPEGVAEVKRRKAEAYAKNANERDVASLADAFHQAQKHGVPYAALAALKAGPTESLAMTSARQFLADKEALFLVLLGPTGSGKTLAASRVCLDFCARFPWNQQSTGHSHQPLHYADAAALTRLSAFDGEAKRQVQELKDAKLLVLEDAGDEGTDLGRGVLVELLMHRHATRRRTVLTSNLSPAAFKQRYGDAVSDRIRSTGLIPNLFGEKSRRKPRKDT